MEKAVIGFLVERQRAYGRAFCEGAASFAAERPELQLRMLEWDDFRRAGALAPCDAYVVRILDDRMERMLRRTGRPVVDVFYGRPRAGFAVVDLDNAATGDLAASHFLERRFTAFGYCGYEGVRFSDARREAFVAAVSRAGYSCRVYATPRSAVAEFADAVVRSERYCSSGGERTALGAWLKGLPKGTALFCSHDLRAYQVLEICREEGISVPGDLAVLGVDDDRILCSFTSPTLSSIDPDGFGAGRRAVESAFWMLTHPGRIPPPVFVPPCALAVRGSTETYPVEPAWLSDALVFIEREAKNGISSVDVCRHVKLSHTTVADAFRRVLGVTVRERIAKVRLEGACRLLRTTDLSVREVARLAGYAGDQYFCREFRRQLRTTPTAWRSSTRADVRG